MTKKKTQYFLWRDLQAHGEHWEYWIAKPGRTLREDKLIFWVGASWVGELFYSSYCLEELLANAQSSQFPQFQEVTKKELDLFLIQRKLTQ